ncbi:MAG: hypothetical protein II581_00575, partial [Oscillospiraceae bacterium]|nr:hypothetical protein [Oscillospiraceae bacterium]
HLPAEGAFSGTLLVCRSRRYRKRKRRAARRKASSYREIASVGLTEAEAKDRGIAIKVGKGLMSANGRTVIVDGDRGFMKLIADAETGKLLGAHLMCERSTDMISQLSVAIANGLTVAQLRRVIRPHPTFEEAMTDALADLAKKF